MHMGLTKLNDAIVYNCRKVPFAVVLRPLTLEAEEWCSEHLKDALLWGDDAFVIEVNNVTPILTAMRQAGLRVS